MEEIVFKALSDPNRRLLLDWLFERDGQTLLELEKQLPEMTRFGVMKHLRVLEVAGLLSTRRQGRQKLHFLNPVPIRLILDRWISKYAQPWVGAMVGLKTELEGATMTEPKHVYELYIGTTPEKLWQAITSTEFTKRYFNLNVESDWKTGSPYRYTFDDGSLAHFGTLLEVDPPRKLVQTFEHELSQRHGGGPEDRSRVTWEIKPHGAVCKLTLIHDGWRLESKSFQSSAQGWPMILSGLKTLLETGAQLPMGDLGSDTSKAVAR
ncbi:MAG TPA: SRPBCC domain-containing protein [Candidatus Binataceae bacterium]